MTNQIDKAPAGATHRYEHAGLVSWYREVDGNMFTWRDGSWFASFFKSAQDLAQSCMLGKVTPLVADTAQQVDDDLTWLARNTHKWPDIVPGRAVAAAFVSDGSVRWLEYPPVDWDGCYRKHEWLARRAKLQNKPSWKDAPEWVTHIAQRYNGRWLFLRCGELGEVTWKASKILDCNGPAGEVLGDWRDTLEQRPIKSSIIDWSTAPAGATHHIGGDKLECPWHRVGGKLRYWNCKIWVKRSAFHTLDEAVAKGFAVVSRPADLSSEAVSKRLDEAAQNVLAAVPVLMDEKYSFDPSVRPDMLQEHRAVTVAEGARSHADQEATRTAMLYCDLMRRLRANPEHLDADEFAALHQLCDAELTKRDAAVCGGEHAKKFVLVLPSGGFGLLVEGGGLTWTHSLGRATLMAEKGWEKFKRFGNLAEVRNGKLVMRVRGGA